MIATGSVIVMISEASYVTTFICWPDQIYVWSPWHVVEPFDPCGKHSARLFLKSIWLSDDLDWIC